MTTKDTILNCALHLSGLPGNRYDRLTRRAVANAAKCATGSINYYFKDMDGLRSAVVDEAVSRNVGRVVAAATMDGHPGVAGLTAEERAGALASV